MLYGVKNPHGGDRYGDGIALDFSANVSPLGTPKCVTEAIERGLPELYRSFLSWSLLYSLDGSLQLD